ncbi:MAG: ABC transporter permease [Anaerolineae bacterium]|nr:ABC transporter permease [Anaerolineae bacterium]
MIGSRWAKVLNDLWSNKTRTVLIVLSIAVGLFAVGTIVSARAMLMIGMAQSYQSITPSSGIVRTVETFDEAFVRAVRAMPEVAEVDARRTLDVRVQTGPGKWMTLRLFAVEDYEHILVDKIRPVEGAWPPAAREVLIERSALAPLGVQVGDTILIELPNGNRRELRVSGVAHDMVQVPAQIDGTPYGYLAMDTLAWFGEEYGFNELHLIAVPAVFDDAQEHTLQVVNAVKRRAEKNGLTIPGTMSVEPGMVPLDDILQAILLLMGVLGLLSLFLSAFLIVNTVSALLAQQKRQIGIMKAVGAQTGQIFAMYLAMVIAYGVLALALAAPLSVVGARALSRFMAAQFNFDLHSLDIQPESIWLQVGVALLVPTLTALPPFLGTLRVSAAETMRVGYALGKGRWGSGPIDRLLSGRRLWWARHVLLRPLLLSIRNTFRSKGRLALTLATLALGGAIFISVFSVQASLNGTLDDILRWWNFDLLVILARPYRIERIEREALRVPGVVQTDVWFQLSARRNRPDGSESSSIVMFAPRAESEMSPGPTIVQGRWLLPEDENALVVSTIFLQKEPDVRLGDEIVLKVMGRELRYRVVGVSMGIMTSMVYGHYPYIAEATGQVGQTSTLLVRTAQHDSASVALMAEALETYLEGAGIQVSDVQTVAGERAEAQASFAIIITLLLLMALLLAVVGGLGLMGTMSINVLERTREIGVLRAIGAPNRGVAQVFILEGVTIGVLSWAIGAVLAAPLGRLLSNAVGVPLMGTPLRFSYSLEGFWLWLGVVALLSALASFLPARNASRLTVREVLAYE